MSRADIIEEEGKLAEILLKSIHTEQRKLSTLIETGGAFQEFSGPSFRSWRTVLAATFGEDITDFDAEVYEKCTGRTVRPELAKELWLIIGRRGGKSRLAALMGIFLAIFREYTVAPGEVPVVMVLAEDRRQARVVMRYMEERDPVFT